MDILVPAYYPEFQCIAHRCGHSCCIGWEIDIDEDTVEYYREVEGELGARLRDEIVCEDGVYSFKLDEDERCPFLNGKGLCDIICELGDEGLCQICSDHPRFKNYLSDRTEVGLGLCCEEAARLILTWKEPFALLSYEGGECGCTPFEEKMLAYRQSVLDILTDREKTVEERVRYLGIQEPCARELIPFYRALERLDDTWDSYLDRYNEDKENIPEMAKEQLLCYFIYRYLAQAKDERELTAYTKFALLSCRIILGVCGDSIDGFIEAARMYSSEVEYSTDNMEMLINKLI